MKRAFKKATVYITMFASAFMATILLAGCGSRIPDTYYFTYDVGDGQIIAHIVPETLSRDGAELKIINNTEYIVMWGLMHSLEVNRRNTWAQVDFLPGAGGFESIGFGLHPNEYIKIPQAFDLRFGGLGNGRYRIVKQVIVDNEQNDRVQLVVEFTINNQTVQENE